MLVDLSREGIYNVPMPLKGSRDRACHPVAWLVDLVRDPQCWSRGA